MRACKYLIMVPSDGYAPAYLSARDGFINMSDVSSMHTDTEILYGAPTAVTKVTMKNGEKHTIVGTPANLMAKEDQDDE